VVHEARQLIESGVGQYWQLKAINAIRFELPKKDRNETIEVLIGDQVIRELLFRSARIR
jgi:hypothetical protein